ncbi:hypothetical protein, partial [Enterobacter quasiroggenkampii]|uniref:hypothetical protein n=1 Tax=Enterobacter quasiroggenkampii TaxID=2497436 RepID=UPI0021D0A815
YYNTLILPHLNYGFCRYSRGKWLCGRENKRRSKREPGDPLVASTKKYGKIYALCAEFTVK